MKIRRSNFEVFSLSAVDLFASAMGAFVLLSIILMPDYGKTARTEDSAQHEPVEEPRNTADLMARAAARRASIERKVGSAEQRLAEIRAQEATLLDQLRVVENATVRERPRDSDAPEPVMAEPVKNRVSFRFLGMKTRGQDFAIVVATNKHLASHASLVQGAVKDILESLQPGHAFTILAYQYGDDGVRYQQWPEGGAVAEANAQNRIAANDFMRRIGSQFGGAASTFQALQKALAMPVDAIFLISDGFVVPAANDGLGSDALVARITQANGGRKQIHTVTVGEYFRYRGTVDFMQALARANDGGFQARAP